MLLMLFRRAGLQVLGMVAIFTYGFPLAEENFKRAECNLYTLGNYSVLIEQALQNGYIDDKDVNLLMRWRENQGNGERQDKSKKYKD